MISIKKFAEIQLTIMAQQIFLGAMLYAFTVWNTISIALGLTIFLFSLFTSIILMVTWLLTEIEEIRNERHRMEKIIA